MTEPTLLNILENTVSSNKEALENAQAFLENAANVNFLSFCEQLSQILCTPSVNDVCRRAAGLQLKNQLTSKEQTTRNAQVRRWIESEVETKNRIKQNILNTLGTETYRPSTAAQCVAAIACAELPHNLWPELVSFLCQKITNPESSDMLKESAIEALGYICQDCDAPELENKSNELLTAIVSGGMQHDVQNDNVKLAAANALLNSLELTRNNFENANERNFIMQVICEATQSINHKIKVTALQCLVKIMSLYYQFMETYMGPALFAITLDAMKSSEEDVSLQGIEFWSSVCDEEMDLLIEAQEAAEQGRAPENVSRHYTKGALQYVVPILLETLAKQDDDEDEWNPCKAASVCLSLVANVCENDIVPHVLPFVEANIQSTSWNNRDAAIMAFGCILEGPDTAALKPLVSQVFNPFLVNMLRDVSPAVQDTAAWAIGRVCEVLPDLAVAPEHVQHLVSELLEALNREPRVAANVCWAFTSLSSAAYEYTSESEHTDEPATFSLSPFYEVIVQALIATTDRQDAGQSNLRTSAYEAIMELVKNSPQDCYVHIQSTTIAVMERLQKIIYLDDISQLSATDRQQFTDLQSLLCATLQSVLRKIKEEDAVQIADRVMEALLQMLNTKSAAQSSGVQEDALMAMSTLVERVKGGFNKYMSHFFPFLKQYLQNADDPQLCQAAVGLVSDLARSMGTDLMPYCNDIMTVLLHHLSNNSIDKSVKPPIISVFGDIALGIGPAFITYVDIVLNTLHQASQLQVNREDFEMVDYLNELRESCLEGYTGIVQGFRGDQPSAAGTDPNSLGPAGDLASQPLSNELAAMQQHVQNIVKFILDIAQDEDRTDGLVSGACGLVGDLIAAYGPKIVHLFEDRVFKDLLQEGRKSKQQKTKTLAIWASKELKNCARV